MEGLESDKETVLRTELFSVKLDATFIKQLKEPKCANFTIMGWWHAQTKWTDRTGWLRALNVTPLVRWTLGVGGERFVLPLTSPHLWNLDYVTCNPRCTRRNQPSRLALRLCTCSRLPPKYDARLHMCSATRTDDMHRHGRAWEAERSGYLSVWYLKHRAIKPPSLTLPHFPSHLQQLILIALLGFYTEHHGHDKNWPPQPTWYREKQVPQHKVMHSCSSLVFLLPSHLHQFESHEEGALQFK